MKDDTKYITVHIRMNDKEKNTIKKRADLAGKNFSEFIRMSAMGCEIREKADKEFSNTTKLAVVDRFKLEKAKKQSDKQVIASLEREVQTLRQQLNQQDKLAELLRQIDAKIDQLPEKISDLIDQNSESKSHSNTSVESQSDDQLTSLNSLIDNSDQSNVAADNQDDGSEQDFDFYNNDDQ